MVIPGDACNTSTTQAHCSLAGDITNEAAVKVLPFFRGRKVITAASLSGNNLLHAMKICSTNYNRIKYSCLLESVSMRCQSLAMSN